MKKLKSLQKQLQDGCLITLITNPRLHREKNKMFALDSRGHEEDSAKCNAELRLLFVVAHPNAKRPQGVIHLLALTDKTDQQDSIDYWRPKLNLLDPPP